MEKSNNFRLPDKFTSKELTLTFDDVLIEPTISSVLSRFNDDECLPFVYENGRKCLPIVSSPMDSIPSPEFIDEASEKLMSVFSCRFLSLERQVEHIRRKPGYVGGVIGLNSTEAELQTLINAGAYDICVDVAYGANEHVKRFLSQDFLQNRRKNGVIKLWGGNAANAEGYVYLSDVCDFVRVSVGSGSACTTRIGTGCGRALVSALLESRESYEKIVYNKFPAAKIVADGGLKYNGDFAKAYVAGAHVVMSGRTFVATYESAGQPFVLDKETGKLRSKNYHAEHPTHKAYRGMASLAVNQEANKNLSKVSVEGASGFVKITGYAKDVIQQIENNLRSALSYTNCRTVEDLYYEAKFSIVSPSVIIENRAHGFD